MTVLKKALKLAKERGYTRAAFAKHIIGIGTTKLWQVENGNAKLKPTEAHLVREWYRIHSQWRAK